jgi:hypothetical protein
MLVQVFRMDMREEATPDKDANVRLRAGRGLKAFILRCNRVQDVSRHGVKFDSNQKLIGLEDGLFVRTASH